MGKLLRPDELKSNLAYMRGRFAEVDAELDRLCLEVASGVHSRPGDRSEADALLLQKREEVTRIANDLDMLTRAYKLAHALDFLNKGEAI